MGDTSTDASSMLRMREAGVIFALVLICGGPISWLSFRSASTRRARLASDGRSYPAVGIAAVAAAEGQTQISQEAELPRSSGSGSRQRGGDPGLIKGKSRWKGRSGHNAFARLECEGHSNSREPLEAEDAECGDGSSEDTKPARTRLGCKPLLSGVGSLEMERFPAARVTKFDGLD